MNRGSVLFVLACCLSGLTAGAQQFHFIHHSPHTRADIHQANVIFQGHNNLLWIGTAHGLLSFDGSTFRKYDVQSGVNAAITVLDEGPDGVLWMGSEEGVVYHLIRDTLIEYCLSRHHCRLDAAITGMAHTDDGTLWISTYGGGIYGFQHDSLMSHVREETGLRSNDFYTMIKDQTGNLWFASDAGITILRPDEQEKPFVSIDRHTGLADEVIPAIAQDRKVASGQAPLRRVFSRSEVKGAP